MSVVKKYYVGLLNFLRLKTAAFILKSRAPLTDDAGSPADD